MKRGVVRDESIVRTVVHSTVQYVVCDTTPIICYVIQLTVIWYEKILFRLTSKSVFDYKKEKDYFRLSIK